MTIKMPVTVGRSDIEDGHPCNSNRCPVANAVRRAAKAYTVDIGNTTGTYYRHDDAGDRVRGFFQLPPEAVTFIARFDQRQLGPIAPFRFTVWVDESHA